MTFVRRYNPAKRAFPRSLTSGTNKQTLAATSWSDPVAQSANRNTIFENFKAVSLGTMPMNQNIGSVCVPTTVSTLDNWDRPLTYVITPKKRPAAQDDYPPRCQAGPKWRIAQGLLEASTLVESRAFTGNYCGDGNSVASTATSFAVIRSVFTSGPPYRFSSMTRSCSNAVRSRSRSACSALIFAFSAAAFGWRPAGDRRCISAECWPKRPFRKRAL